MKFILGFYTYQSGYEEEAWLNMSLIKSYKVTDCLRKASGRSEPGYLLCDMGSESTNKVPFINANQPLEIKDAVDVFQLAIKKPLEFKEPKKRGRPRKFEPEGLNP